MRHQGTRNTHQETSMNTSSSHPRYELRFRSLYRPGRGFTFPCDAAGRVDMDSLSDGERDTYLYARTVIGSELAMPAVQLSAR
jgi:hypothetical protein